ncbi:hypothetical protein LCGC14_2876170 [marine sediment metagenome]|uniref:Uncharacterized protein n=1 Tax=marine sediment metagenome TaxID=412755 RepID=A0A0F8Y1P1_9ZZZZ
MSRENKLIKVFEYIKGQHEVCFEDDYATGGVCLPHRKQDAERIVACWNAFTNSDIPTSRIAPGLVEEMRDLLRRAHAEKPHSMIGRAIETLLAHLKPETDDG